MKGRQAAKLMRELDETTRNFLIATAENVIDLRKILEERKKQRALAISYRKPWHPLDNI